MNSEFEFSISLKYEIFYALHLLTDDQSKIHKEWKQISLGELPGEFHEKIASSGLRSEIWIILSDMLKAELTDGGFVDLIDAIRKCPEPEMKKNVLEGVLHYPEIVDEVISHQINLETAIKKIPKGKYEWLAYVGLYPYNPSSAIGVTLELLLDRTFEFKSLIIELLAIFWDCSFEKTWRDLLPKLEESMDEKKRLFVACDLPEFAKSTLLPIEINEKQKLIKALRGGYEVSFNAIEKLIFIPSVFNYKRIWSAYKTFSGKTAAIFPYFETRISLSDPNGEPAKNEMMNNLDPAFIFKALGDVTRFSIVCLIAAEPKSSIELAKRLSISKATVSHHVHILREAGLIDDSYENGSVKLRLKRNVIESLSDITLLKLYGHI